MTDTASTVDLVKALVEFFLAFDGGTNRVVADIIDDRCYVSQAPDDVAGTYVVLRYEVESDPEIVGREMLKLNATVITRPRAKEQEADLVAELFMLAMRSWTGGSAEDGLVVITDAQRVSEPIDTDPEDREVVQKTVRCEGYCFATYLNAGS